MRADSRLFWSLGRHSMNCSWLNHALGGLSTSLRTQPENPVYSQMPWGVLQPRNILRVISAWVTCQSSGSTYTSRKEAEKPEAWKLTGVSRRQGRMWQIQSYLDTEWQWCFPIWQPVLYISPLHVLLFLMFIKNSTCYMWLCSPGDYRLKIRSIYPKIFQNNA